MKKYQLVFLTQPELSKNSLDEVFSLLEKEIVKAGGKIKKKEKWEKQVLAYPIAGQDEAFFWIWQLAFEQELKLASVNTFLNREDRIIRYLFLKVRH